MRDFKNKKYKCFIFDYYGTLFNPNTASENIFFDGIPDLIKQVSKNNLCAIATRTPLYIIKEHLKKAELFDCFASIKSTELAHDKPDPYILNEILCELDIDPKHALMIGDSISDLAFGFNAKVDSVLVNFTEFSDFSGSSRSYNPSESILSDSILKEVKKYSSYPVITSVSDLRELII